MIIVVSQAWTKDADGHADAYIAFSEEFGRFFDDHPGFHRRMLVRGTDDRTHFLNLRFFDKVADYEECTQRDGYVEHTQKMYEHMKPYDSYPREYVEVILDTGPGDSADKGFTPAP
jgi:antibiotic biosynthesis monooxygenase (ABM) superfamily enzyme